MRDKKFTSKYSLLLFLFYNLIGYCRMAERLNLNSKSYGKGENRYLVVSCRLDRWHLVQRIMEEGGETDDYKLIYPTDL